MGLTKQIETERKNDARFRAQLAGGDLKDADPETTTLAQIPVDASDEESDAWQRALSEDADARRN